MAFIRPGASSAPSLGAHGAKYDTLNDAASVSPNIVTLATQAGSSSFVQFLVGGPLSTGFGVPSDNKGNSYGASPLDTSGYAGGLWPDFGVQVYVKANGAGGASHAFSVTKSPADGECSHLVAEIKNAGTLKAHSIVARAGAGAGVPYTSNSVTTDGPATLVALWAGDGDTNVSSMNVTVENGWTVIESKLVILTQYAQSAMATKDVGAGTHTVSWTPTANQGAILSLLAFQH